MKRINGFTLIELLIGIFVFSLVFLAISGLIIMTMRASADVQNRINASALIQAKLETAKNTSYEEIGIIDGYPSGIFEATETEIMGGKEYLVKTRVDYIVDPKDGVADPDDECPNDYKKMEVEVSWQKPYAGRSIMATNLVPDNLAQECLEEGGVLSVNVFDALGEMVANPTIEIIDPETLEVVKTAVPDSGHHYFSLPVGSYRAVASKTGYSVERTYGVEEIAAPSKINPNIANGKSLEINLSIDKLSSVSVNTLYPWVTSDFSDSFSNMEKISDFSGVVASGGKLLLEKEEDSYVFSGYAVSDEINPTSLIEWVEFQWEDEKTEGTGIRYQLFFSNDGENWNLIPDGDLAGNSIGFSDSPLDLSGLNIGTYYNLKLRANLSTSNQAITPYLDEWIISWKSSGGMPAPNVLFNMRGDKKIGKNELEEFVYKHDTDNNSGPAGKINLSEVEWDSYSFSILPAGLELESIEPSPQPIGVDPDTSQTINLFVESQNSLLFTIKNSETLEPIFSASVRIYKEGYDLTLYTDNEGMVHFIPLDSGQYNVEAQASGYESNSDLINVSGAKTAIIQLTQIE